MNAPLLDVRGLRKFFPIAKGLRRRISGMVRAVDDVSFTVQEGEALGLVGESGCGKTTTARCILRAIDPTGGEVLYRTRDNTVVGLAPMSARELGPFRKEIQMIFQDPFGSLNPRMTLFDNVGEPLLVNGMRNRRERLDRVAELLRLVGLRPEFMHRFPHAFSGGQRQRIGIARALISQPSLIIADEPVSALDVSTQAQIVNLLSDLQADFNLSFLFITHDLSVVKHISQDVAVMYLGGIVETGPTRMVFDNPSHPYTQALLSAVPQVDRSAEPKGRRQRIILSGEVPSLVTLPTGCTFHTRCPRYIGDICKQQAPQPRDIGGGHIVRCHLYNDVGSPVLLKPAPARAGDH
jgi:peptide/nickel transport system ATP-binding protein